MPPLRRSKSRSRIVLSSLPPHNDPSAGLRATDIYHVPGRRFSAKLLGIPPLLSVSQVYCSATQEATEVSIDEENELFALHWNGRDLLDAVMTLRELKRLVRVNGKRIDILRGHHLRDDDKIEVGPPLSALEGTKTGHLTYKALARLGKGSYGRVLRVRDTSNDQHLSIKTVEVEADERDNAMREPVIWRDLVHEFVCQYHRHWVDAISDSKKLAIYIVMDYAPFGSLASFVDMKRGPPSDLVNRRVASQICKAFEYLHGEKIAHCDFKPDNVVIERLDTDGNPEKVLVIDFGLALRVEHLHKLKRAVEDYRAPEIGLAGNITVLVDSFAIAATLFNFVTNGYELVERKPPPPKRNMKFGRRVNAAEEANRNRILRLDDLNSYPKYLKEFITDLSLEDPAERMSPAEALRHLWLQPRVSPEPISGSIEEVEFDYTEDEKPVTTKRNRSQRSATPSSPSQLRCGKRPRGDS
ncbi:kinase-like protein [Peniophora sp. CONT]|nr:kinase-like protein [Peniophora sp. CONT]